MVVYALLGSSRPLSVSTTTTIAILCAAALGRVAAGPDLMAASATLALLVGAMLVLAFALRLGFVANFNLRAGADRLQIGNRPSDRRRPAAEAARHPYRQDRLPARHFRNPARTAADLARHAARRGAAARAHLPAGALRAALAAPLIAVAAAIAARACSASRRRRRDRRAPFRADCRRSPGRNSTWPCSCAGGGRHRADELHRDDRRGRAFSAQGEPHPEPNRELLAVGLANFAGGWLGAMPAGGGTTQTAVNRRAERRHKSQNSSPRPLRSPRCSSSRRSSASCAGGARRRGGGVSLELIRPAEFGEIRRVRHVEFYWALIAFAGVVFLGTLNGILVAVIASLLALCAAGLQSAV